MKHAWLALLLSALLFTSLFSAPALADEPGPGRDLSFLSDYVDALQVGDWYLACTAATGEGRYEDVTRNETANWQLLNGRGEVLADGLRWWPKDEAWPAQPRPFEGFEDGVDTAVIRVGQKYGLIDRAGRIVVEPVYDTIFGFLAGDVTTPVERDGRWGAIDAAGNVVVPIVYDISFARFEGGVTDAERGGRHCLLGEDGTELLSAIYDVIWLDDGAEYGMARADGVVSLFDRQGEVLFESELGENSWIYCYADAEPPFAFNDEHDRWGYLDLDGTRAFEGAFEDAWPFWTGSEAALVQVNGRQGMVRRDGSFAVAPEYEELAGYSEGLCRAMKDGLWGYLDETGNVAIPFQFESAGDFKNGCADARPAGDGADPATERHGLIDRSGNWVIEPMGCAHIDVGPDGVAVASEARGEETACFLAEDGFRPVAALVPRGGSFEDGYRPNEDAGKLAALDEAPTLSKRVSKDRLPRLDGAHRLYPLFAAYVQAIYPKDTRCCPGWNSYREDGDATLTATGERTAWQRLSDGDADVIFVPAPDPDDPVWATLAARGQTPEFIPLCREALVFPVNAANPVADVTAAQLEQVYSGGISDWTALGADLAGGIVAYQTGSAGDDLTRQAFRRLCGFAEVMEALQGVTGYDDWEGGACVGAVDYRNLPNAIGYALRRDCLALLEAGEIRLLSVDGAAPTDENIESGAYPWALTLYAVRLKDNDNPNVLALLDWIRSEQGGELIRKTGFVPVNEGQ